MAILGTGTILADRYEIVRVISSGGMGVVYEVRDLGADGAPCALKQLLDHDVDDASMQILRRKFDEEMRFLGALRHDGIPRLRDHFTVGTRAFLVMDLVEGETLEHELDAARVRGRALSAAQVADDAIEILGILEYLHGRRPPVLHRDIKPANIVRERGSGRLKLLDFGIARLHEGRATTHTQLGTLTYAPLEQIQGHAEPRSDLYSLGVTMHHLISGSEPAPLALPPLQRVAPFVDADLAAIVNRAVAAAAIDRFENATTMREALADWRARLDDAGGAAAATEIADACLAADGRAPSASGSKPVSIGFGVAAVVAVVLGLVLAQLLRASSPVDGGPQQPRAGSPAPLVAVASPTTVSIVEQREALRLQTSTADTATRPPPTGGASPPAVRPRAASPAPRPRAAATLSPGPRAGASRVSIIDVPPARAPRLAAPPPAAAPAPAPAATAPPVPTVPAVSTAAAPAGTLDGSATDDSAGRAGWRRTAVGRRVGGRYADGLPGRLEGRAPQGFPGPPDAPPDGAGPPGASGASSLRAYTPSVPAGWSVSLLQESQRPPRKEFLITSARLDRRARVRLSVWVMPEAMIPSALDRLVSMLEREGWEVSEPTSQGDTQRLTMRASEGVGEVGVRAEVTRPGETMLRIAVCTAPNASDLGRLQQMAEESLLR